MVCKVNKAFTSAMHNRRVRLFIHGIVVGALLFAQAVGAAQACTAALDTPVMAFSDMDCADMPSQNVCLHQYLTGDQNSATPQIPVATLPPLAVLTVPSTSVARPAAPYHSRKCPPGNSDPPASIRFCSFQI